MINPIKKFFTISAAIVLLSGIVSLSIAAPQDTYPFTSPAQRQTFTELTQEFRCLVCQNESLADSNAALARDLRKQIADLLQQGASKQQVKQYLVQRYGQFILFKPPFETITYLLWLGPFIALFGGILGLLYSIHQRGRKTDKRKLTAQEQQCLQQLLAKAQD